MHAPEYASVLEALGIKEDREIFDLSQLVYAFKKGLYYELEERTVLEINGLEIPKDERLVGAEMLLAFRNFQTQLDFSNL